MTLSIETLSIAKKYTDKTINGLGAVKGANATIKSIDKVSGINTVTFEWTGNDGAKETASIQIKDGNDGDDGVSIVSAIVNDKKELVLILSNGNEINAGKLPGADEALQITKQDIIDALGFEPENYDDTSIKEELDNKANSSDIPTNLSQLNNDANFINSSVGNLVNYYLKNETYTKQEVLDLIGKTEFIAFNKVDVLPTIGEEKYVYLVQREGSDVHDEYIYVNGKWEIIGNTSIDLNGYATESWVNAKGYLTEHQDISNKADKDYVDELSSHISMPSLDYDEITRTAKLKNSPRLTNAVYLDDSLTKSGYASDSKVVGDEIKEIKQSLETIAEKVNSLVDGSEVSY